MGASQNVCGAWRPDSLSNSVKPAGKKSGSFVERKELYIRGGVYKAILFVYIIEFNSFSTMKTRSVYLIKAPEIFACLLFKMTAHTIFMR